MCSFAVAMWAVKCKNKPSNALPLPQNFKEKLTCEDYTFIVTMEDVKAVIVHL